MSLTPAEQVIIEALQRRNHNPYAVADVLGLTDERVYEVADKHDPIAAEEIDPPVGGSPFGA